MAVETPTPAVPSREHEAASRRWTLARVALAVTYLLGGLAHLVLAATNLAFYESFADMALVGTYTEVWRDLVVPNLAVLVPVVGLFELAIGVALLWRGRAVQVAHTGGAVFQVGLVLSGPWGVVNAALAGIHALAARRPSPVSIPERIRRWRAT